MIALLGATGTVGRHVAAALPDARVLRRPEADLRDVTSLSAGLDGVATLFLLTPHDPDQELLEANALRAARDAGVSRVVKLSGGAPSLGPNGPTPTAVAHFRSEQAIEASGLSYTFLRPSFMMQNLQGMVAKRGGLLPAPFGRAPIAMVDARDVAACTVAALTEPPGGPLDATAWHLTGPRGVTFADVATALGARYVPVPPRLAGRALKRRGASSYEVDHALRMAAYFASGADATPTDAVQRLTGTPPRSVEAFVAQTYPPNPKAS